MSFDPLIGIWAANKAAEIVGESGSGRTVVDFDQLELTNCVLNLFNTGGGSLELVKGENAASAGIDAIFAAIPCLLCPMTVGLTLPTSTLISPLTENSRRFMFGSNSYGISRPKKASISLMRLMLLSVLLKPVNHERSVTP